MKPGEKFELEALDFLKSNFSDNDIEFLHNDTADSTGSDIEVCIRGKSKFFIEVKDTAAQSGQFVVFANESTKTFSFSPNNKSEENEMTDIIIKHMNDNFERYSSAGTAGETIDIIGDVFAKWICNYYEEKKVSFFISRKTDFIIFPIEKFFEYFEISASYRVKKSGSTHPAKKYADLIKEEIKKEYPTANFSCERNKMFVNIRENLGKTEFRIGKYDYLVAKRDSGKYEIRKLSNTNNKNVIFSIRAKKEQKPEDVLLFKKKLGIR